MCRENLGPLRNGEAWDLSSPVNIRGLVVPSAWDTKGRVIQVAICCPDEKEYRVRHEGLGVGLEEMIHRCVEVTGRLIPDGKGGQEIVVAQFRKAD